MRDVFVRFTLLSGTGSLAVLALHFAKPLLRRAPAKWPVCLWLLLGLRMLVPLGFSLPMPAREILPTPIMAIEIPMPTIVSPGFAALAAAVPAQTPVDWLGIAMAIWLSGAVIFLAWHIAVYLHARQKLLHEAAVIDSALWRKLCAEYGFQPRLLQSPAAQTPMAFGLLRPVIVLPAREFSGMELDCVLRHEFCHLKAKHLPMKFLLLAVNALHWCNPAAWLLRHDAAAAMEQCCDEMALRGATNEQRGVYSQTLLACAGRRRFAPALTSNWNGGTNEMKARLRNIFTAKPKKTILASAIVLLCAALAVTAAGIGPGLVAGGKATNIRRENGRNVADVTNPAGETESVILPEPGEDCSAVAQLNDGSKYNIDASGNYTPLEAQTMPSMDEVPAPVQLLWPAPGVNTISADYGGQGDNSHGGIDITSPKADGKTVVAAAGGYVEGTGSGGENGVYIVINHGGGLWTAYEHLQEGSVTLQFGEKVDAGQPIAKIGSTGQSTGPHLHFEVLLNNVAVDPMPFLQQL